MNVPPPRESGYTKTTSVPLYWAVYGPVSQDRLLVLHGGPGAHHDYLLPQMLALANDRELVFYDQRGGGKSKTDDRTPITWQTQVEDLDRVVVELDLGSPTILGYSWGGLLAMLYAIEAAAGRRQSHPHRLVLIDPAPITRRFRETFESEFSRRQSSLEIVRLREELAGSGLREKDADTYRHRMFELSVAGYFADPKAAHDLTPFRVTGRVQASVWESLNDYNLTAAGLLDSVSVPTLVVHGRQDPIPFASSEAAAKALHAELVVVEHSGHVPYVEQPDALFNAIRAFLNGS